MNGTRTGMMAHASGQGLARAAARIAVVLLAGGIATAGADPAVFDLAGPTLEVEVTRNGTTLPAAQVPNLEVGDKVWMKADLSAAQSTHYLMVAVLLRGATNPPPSNWFHRCE